jgi:hypothetical protein
MSASERDLIMSDIVQDVSPTSLVWANEANLARGFAACVRAYDGEVVDEPDLLWCAGPGAAWTRVLRSDLAPETLDDRIEWVIELGAGVAQRWRSRRALAMRSLAR